MANYNQYKKSMFLNRNIDKQINGKYQWYMPTLYIFDIVVDITSIIASKLIFKLSKLNKFSFIKYN